MGEGHTRLARLLNRRRAAVPAVELTLIETAPVEMSEHAVRSVPPRRGGQIPLVVFYDGDCGLCSGVVRWLIARDRRRLFHFAPLDGETAAQVAGRHASLPAGIDSLLLLDRRGGRETIHWYADAVVRVAAELPAPIRWLGWSALLPRAVTDVGYRLVARFRHRLGPRAGAPHQTLSFAEYPRFLP